MAFLDPYRRITSWGRLISEIDGLRFIAILSVFVYHLTGDILRHTSVANQPAIQSSILFPTTQVLNIGVQLFFVISGFILGMPFAASYRNGRGMVPISTYFKRRITRLELPYILSLLVFFQLKILSGKGTTIGLLPHLMASVFYIHDLVFKIPSSINFVAWSLEVEVQFYIVAPVLALIFGVQSKSFRISIFAFLILLSTGIAANWPHKAIVQLSLLGACQYFLVGFLAAEAYVAKAEKKYPGFIWDIAFIIIGPLVLFLLTTGSILSPWLTPWMMLILLLGTLNGNLIKRILGNPWVTTLGGMCYSIYLIHNYLIAAAGNFTEHFLGSSPFAERLLLQSFLIGFPVLVISSLYFRLVERPCMLADWPQRLANRIRTASTKFKADSTGVQLGS